MEGGRQGRSIDVPRGLIRNEEEVAFPGPRYRPTQSAAGLRAPKFSSWYSRCVRKKIVRVQCLIAAEGIDVSMKLRSARFSFDIYVGACTAAVLGIIKGILDLELLNGIRCGDRNACATERSNLGHVEAITIPIHAVEHEVVVATSCTIGADLLAPGPPLGRIQDIGVRSSRQAENFGVIPIDQRQADYSFWVNDSSKGAFSGWLEES